MRASYDVVVIGGGSAGVAAALAARAAGAETALVRAAPGATAISSGGWTGPLDPLLARALERAGLPYVESPHPLPHPFGELRSFDFAGASHVAPDAPDNALLVGIAGLGAFATPTLSRLYAMSPERPLQHITAVLAGTPAAGWSPMSLAAAIQRDPLLLADAIAPHSRGVSHVIVPAVLGLADVDDVRARVSEAAGVAVFEMLGAPPSIPGLRLDQAFIRALRSAGTDVITGIVHGCDAARDVVERIHVSVNGTARTMLADRFVLASGKFMGGGVATLPITAREHALVETALGLPVWIEHLDQTFTNAESLTLTSRVRTYDQPLLRAGVHTSSSMQPLDARGRTVYRNVSVAGTVDAGGDAMLGLGHAASRGIRAIMEQNI